MRENIRKFTEAFENCVRPRTLPIGMKLLKDEADIPHGIRRATSELGHRVNLCQAFAFSRYRKVSLAMLKEDLVCPLGAMVLGLVEPPVDYLSGEIHIKRRAETMEAAGRIASSLFRFKHGIYKGAVTAPLSACDFDIDVVLIYVNAFQLGNLIWGSLYKEGGRFSVQVLPDAVCDIIVPAVEEDSYYFNIPCGGDRRYGRSADDEILFAVPASKLEELSYGLISCLNNGGIRITNRQWLEFEPRMPERYYKIMQELRML